MNELLVNLLLAVSAPIAGFVGVLLAKLIKKAIDQIENNKIQSFAYLAVRWAQDKFKDISGSERYNEAIDKLASKVNGISGAQLEEAIRAAYTSMKAELGNVVSVSTEPSK